MDRGAMSQGSDSSISNLLRRREGFESYDQNQRELCQNENPNQKQNSPGTGIGMYQALISSFRYFWQIRNPYNQRHTKGVGHRGYSGQHSLKKAQGQEKRNPRCYPYEHVTGS